MREFGSGLDWYNWRIQNWSTRSNAGEVTEKVNYHITLGSAIQFQTAWANPLPVILELSRLFPEELITVHYADEEIGVNYGSYTLLNGELDVLDINMDEFDFCTQVSEGVSYEEFTSNFSRK